MIDQPIVSVQDFHKRYGSFVAVDGISFKANRGEIFGLLGPNGAGKTTTLECLEGIRQSDAGSLAVLGVDPGRQPRKLRNLIGVQLQSSGLPGDMTVDEAMRFFCAYHGVPPRYDLLDRLGLELETPDPIPRAVHRSPTPGSPGAGDQPQPAGRDPGRADRGIGRGFAHRAPRARCRSCGIAGPR